jgi:hypothetical protein
MERESRRRLGALPEIAFVTAGHNWNVKMTTVIVGKQTTVMHAIKFQNI